MSTFWLVSYIILWAVVLFLAFLLLGTLRALGLMRWRLEQLEATTPRRLGRDGLRLGARAPDFTLPSVEGAEVSLRDFAGRKILLVFTKVGCNPCRAIVPELNKLQRGGEHQVLVVNNGTPEKTRKWAGEAGVCFPVLMQENWSVSRRYEVFAGPFAFLLNEEGVVVSKGIINTQVYLHYVLTNARSVLKEEPIEVEISEAQKVEA